MTLTFFTVPLRSRFHCHLYAMLCNAQCYAMLGMPVEKRRPTAVETRNALWEPRLKKSQTGAVWQTTVGKIAREREAVVRVPRDQAYSITAPRYIPPQRQQLPPFRVTEPCNVHREHDQSEEQSAPEADDAGL